VFAASASQYPSVAGSNAEGVLALAGESLQTDAGGVLYWPEHRLLAVADLHLEKGSSYAERGVLLPPYDTAVTLARLGALIARYAPRLVIALGDSFHDGRGPRRLADTDRAMLKAMQRGRDWIWIAGNHDPDPAENIGGRFLPVLKVGALTFRHEPTGSGTGEVAGHLHPMARVARRGRSVRSRCFACDGARLVMPAFGSYAGGLNVRDRAFANVFQTLAFTAHMLGRERVYPIAAKNCLPD
jgi:DNA ligase-associated metallophosphoesterase